MTALKKLGLNIRRAKVDITHPENNPNTFFITDSHSSEKILKSTRLEEIRMTIITNMKMYHPVSSARPDCAAMQCGKCTRFISPCRASSRMQAAPTRCAGLPL